MLRVKRGRSGLELLCEGHVPPNFIETRRSTVHTTYSDGPYRVNVYFGPDTPERRKEAVKSYQGGYVTGKGEGAVIAACVSKAYDCPGRVFEKPRKVHAPKLNGANRTEGGVRCGRMHKSRGQRLLSRAIRLQKEKLQLRHDRAERCGFLDPATNAYPGVYTTSVPTGAPLTP